MINPTTVRSNAFSRQHDPAQIWDWDKFIEHYKQIGQCAQLDVVRQGKVLRVVVYARVSTQEQLNGYSIQEQLIAGDKYAQEHKWSVINTYVDEGFSGTNNKRPPSAACARMPHWDALT